MRGRSQPAFHEQEEAADSGTPCVRMMHRAHWSLSNALCPVQHAVRLGRVLCFLHTCMRMYVPVAPKFSHDGGMPAAMHISLLGCQPANPVLVTAALCMSTPRPFQLHTVDLRHAVHLMSPRCLVWLWFKCKCMFGICNFASACCVMCVSRQDQVAGEVCRRATVHSGSCRLFECAGAGTAGREAGGLEGLRHA